MKIYPEMIFMKNENFSWPHYVKLQNFQSVMLGGME